ncbi:MAG: potassium transporter [Thiotrichales bacterium]|nr:MAG: potassium transporter [Thiotrichales bacterium]
MGHMEQLEVIILLLAFAVGVIALFRRINLPPIIGYIFVGLLIGPGGFGIIPSINEMTFLAEFGIVFLMFTLGLEVSLPRLIAMRKILLSVGGLQVLSCTGIAFAIALAVGVDVKAAFVVAAVLALSSTAVAIKQLHEQKEQDSVHGRMSVNVLVFQDIAAVIFLILIPTLSGGDQETSVTISILITLFKGVLVFIALALIGQYLLRPLFHEVAKAHSTEVFMMATLLVALSAAWLTDALGLSMAMGAFLAGLMLGETEFRHQIEIDIRPFKDVLLGLFFITVGAYLNIQDLQAYWPIILSLLCVLLITKAIIIATIVNFFGKIPKKSALQVGVILCQGGELGFLLLSVATMNNVISPELRSITISTLVFSLIIAPILIRYSKKISAYILGDKSIESKTGKDFQPHQLSEHTAELRDHVIVCGFGRVGQILVRFLDQEKIPTVALDLDPMRVSKTSMAGEHSFFGDARNPAILSAAGLSRARMVVISFAEEAAALETLKHIRSLRLDVPVFVRTRNDSNLEAFQKAGATEVVPEALEGSLMLALHLLLALGVPTDRLFMKIRRVHADRYSVLRGYFKGADDYDTIEEDAAARRGLHALTIKEGSVAVDKTIAEIMEGSVDVSLKTLTRGNKRFPKPGHDMHLHVGDVLVLFATPEALDELETKMHAVAS